MPIVASITKSAGTVFSAELAAKQVHEAALAAVTPHRGPVFLDFPLDVFGPAEAELPDPVEVRRSRARPRRRRPGGGHDRRRRAPGGHPRQRRVLGRRAGSRGSGPPSGCSCPCYFNGLGRGCLPADHPLAFTRTRGLLKTDADLVVVVGTALDFRLGFGRFGNAKVVHIVDAPESASPHAGADETLDRDRSAAVADRLAEYQDRVGHEAWIATARERESAARASDDADLLAARRRPDQAHPGVRRADPPARARRRRDLRRRRLRLLRRQVHRRVHAGLLARHRSLRVPGQRPGVRHRRPGGPARRRRSCCCSATARRASA